MQEIVQPQKKRSRLVISKSATPVLTVLNLAVFALAVFGFYIYVYTVDPGVRLGSRTAGGGLIFVETTSLAVLRARAPRDAKSRL